ncbi:MAG: type II toxin-antitoxin system VapC family toxin [Neisseriaceae bacterium]|nr:type II toxin-antitoxin system VapC family toxin [Neisseriaceae bacterium]MBR5675245.1 type II toxin-antitoxin system VapC family toxin [Neisseriaceae bacterium]
MLKYLLDTNIAIYVIKRRPIEILSTFNRNAGKMAVSTITEAELYYGAEKSQRPQENALVIEEFLSHLLVLPYDSKAAQHFGSIKADLSKKGSIIGENDLHIAAHARSCGLILVSNNVREFQRVPNLMLENWI